ncbi:MAG TPA: patatin-like phospholipase family protein [Usitatibacter sp.]|jgi:NTE family protein|nr:patatin-like phospholipase family protein [Usitatibacter sp.]
MRGAVRAAALVLAFSLLGCDDSNVAPERLPRFVQPTGPAPRVALVLGSGGPRGFAHIGVLKALDEAGIKPDIIVGSSVGAMVGALYASGISAAELEKLAYQINVMEFFEFRMVTGGLATGSAIQTYVNEKVKRAPLEQLRIPFVAAATRVSDGKIAIFNHGDTGLAVRASSASPGQFEPVRIGTETYVDGDESSPVPIRVARRLGAKIVIAVDVSAYAQDTPAGVPESWVEKDARRARQVAAEAPQADIVIHPDIGYYAGHTEAYRRQVIEIAERVAKEKIPAIQAALTARMPAADASR